MKKLIYTLLAVSFIFSACKKEVGCTDTIATNYNADAEEDDNSCTYSIIGGSWITQSQEMNGTMTVSFGGINVLDSTINYIETNSDSLDPYKLTFLDDNTYTEYDKSNSAVEGGTWSKDGDLLTINTPDTILVLTINNLEKEEISLDINFIDSGSENGMTFNFDITQTMLLNREW